MNFDDAFELEDAEMETVWNALSDPVLIRRSLPGCQCLTEVEDTEDVDYDALVEAAPDPDDFSFDPEAVEERRFQEGDHYAAVISLEIGPVDARFNTLVTIEEWDFPDGSASGEGGSEGGSSFEMDSGMTLNETADGVEVDWEATVDIFGRLANMGQRLLNPAANKVVKQFFNQMEDELDKATAHEEGETAT